MKKIIPVVIAAIKKNNKFLMTQRIHLDPEDYRINHGAWQLPGGGIEFGETPEQAIHREMKEEIGAEIKIEQLVPKIYTEVRKNWQGIFIVFICRLTDYQTKITLDNETADYGWFMAVQAIKLKTLPGTMQIIRDVLDL